MQKYYILYVGGTSIKINMKTSTKCRKMFPAGQEYDWKGLMGGEATTLSDILFLKLGRTYTSVHYITIYAFCILKKFIITK